MVTAPLSRSLGPIAAPSLTILSAEGEPIARRGAIIGEPVDVDAAAAPCRPGLHRDRGPALLPPYRHRSLGHRPGRRGATSRAGGVREGGSTITQQLAKTSFLSPDRTCTPQGAGGADRALAGGLADQGRDPQPLPLQRLFRRQCLRPARRRPPLFQRRARGADPRPGGDAGRRGQRAEPARPDPQSRRRPRAAPGWCCARWSRAATSPSAQARRRAPGPRPPRPARQTSRPAPISPTGCCPRRATWRDEGYGQRRVRTTLEGDLQRARGARRPPRRPRPRPGGAGRDAARRPGRRDGRRHAIMREARSTAPPRPAASRARRSSCSSISPPSAPA